MHVNPVVRGFITFVRRQTRTSAEMKAKKEALDDTISATKAAVTDVRGTATFFIRSMTMQIPVQVDFQGLTATPQVRAAIEQHLTKLEHYYDRITACRVVLKAPGGRHRNGGQYEVNIRLALPDGREVNISRTPKEDERHADVSFALNEAFKHARRQLEDQVRQMENR